MQKDTNIDNVFKQKAMNFGVKVPSAMFDNIAGDLKKRKKKKRRFIIFFLSLLPVAFVILFAINSFYRNNGIIEDTEKTLKTFQHKDFSKYCFNEKNKAEAKEKAKEADQELDKISQRTKKVTKDKVKEKAEAKDKMNTKEIVKDNADEIKVKDQKNTFDSDFKDKSLVEEKDNLKEAVKTKLDSIPDIIEAVTIIEKTEAKTNSVLDTVDLNSEKTDTLIIDKGPIHTLGDPAGFRRTFTIGFSIGPGRAFRTSDVGLISESFIAQSSDDKAISNFHRNFYIKYQFSERFSFSTGLSFFKIGHIAKFSVNDEYLRFIHAENFGHTSAGFYDLDIR
ncbi:MAG: hypothetical protein H8E98_05155, partial [Bacteroidetes bacterium]|nr:hypothetical protein [Bacteroidota bacterium]